MLLPERVTSWCSTSIAFHHIVLLPQKRQNGQNVHFQFCLWHCGRIYKMVCTSWLVGIPLTGTITLHGFATFEQRSEMSILLHGAKPSNVEQNLNKKDTFGEHICWELYQTKLVYTQKIPHKLGKSSPKWLDFAKLCVPPNSLPENFYTDTPVISAAFCNSAFVWTSARCLICCQSILSPSFVQSKANITTLWAVVEQFNDH